MHSISTFIHYILTNINTQSLVRITFTQSTHETLKKIIITPAYHKNLVTCVYKYPTHDHTSLSHTNDIESLLQPHISGVFLTVIAQSTHTQCHLVYNKRGKIRIYHKQIPAPDSLVSHDQEKKKQYIDFNHPVWNHLKSSHGDSFFTRKKNIQIAQFLRFLDDTIVDTSSIESIVDCGCGKGYLTTALALAYPHATVTGIDTKDTLMKEMNDIAIAHAITNLSYIHSSISEFPIQQTSLVVALHACNTATDDTIRYGINANASYIVCSPCCHQELYPQIQASYNSIQSLLAYGIHKERTAEMITDTLRSLYLKKHHYSVKIIDFISTGHSGKNILIIAQKRTHPRPQSEIDHIESCINTLLRDFSISSHALFHTHV